MRKPMFILLVISLLAYHSLLAETITPGRFREIVALPGDNTPLMPKLAAVPIWTNAVVILKTKYANGKSFQEEMPQAAKNVQGKYVVFSTKSALYNQVMNGILTYDMQTAGLKFYGLFGDGHGGVIITEGTLTYDFDNKTYSMISTYGNFKEVTTGTYSETESSEKTIVDKDGLLFMTREAKTHPAPMTNK